MSQSPHTNPRLEQRVQPALNKIKKPSTDEEITELANRDLGPEERPSRVVHPPQGARARPLAKWIVSNRDSLLCQETAFFRPTAGVKLAICSGRPNTRILSPDLMKVSDAGFKSSSPEFLRTATTVTPKRSRIRDSRND
jgi:hypothetical protein